MRQRVSGSNGCRPQGAALLAHQEAVTQPPVVLRRTFWLCLLCASFAACNDNVTQFVFDARIVDGSGGNPAAGTDATTLRIGIQQGDLPAQTLDYPIDDGSFDATLELAALSLVTRVRVSIEGPTTRLLSSPPNFVPTLSSGFMRLVTASPSSCQLVTFDEMEAPRAFFGMVPSGTFALLAGGAASSDQEQVEYFDALEWESRPFTDDFALSELGETRAASIDEGQILVLPADAGPFIFDMLDPSRRVTTINLHTGAGPRSALVSVPGLGAMVIGGESGGQPQSGVSLVAPDGSVISSSLSEPRAGPAAAALGTDVLVVGGDAEGNAELLRAGSMTGEPVASVMDGARTGGFLIGDGDSRALFMGGSDAGGSVRQDTVRFDGCPASCVSGAGPTWTTARIEVLQLAGSTLIVGGRGSQLVEEVRFDGEQVRIERLLDLTVPRAGAGGIRLESGAFVVAGGDDGRNIRDDMEFCVPSELSPL